jgi:hypothetical protein
MAKANIHIEPIKSSSEIHNKRLKEFDYVRKDLSEKNESWEERSISEVRKEIEEKYLRNVGQKMQKKATPIREGVVLLKPEHTMEDLFRLKEKLYEKLGIKTFQMYIHKDEGHWKSEEKLKQHWAPNLHAHMIFDWTDEKGKSLKLDRKQMSLIQDIISETLEMERGQRATVTGRKHLNPLEYKAKVMLDKIIEIEKKEKDLKKQLEDTQSEKEILKKDLQKLNEKYDEKHTEFQRFFQNDINVSLFKKSISNGFFGGKKEVINEEEIEKLIQNFSFSTENWKNEEKLSKQYLRENRDLQEQLEEIKKENKALKESIKKPNEDYLWGKFLEMSENKKREEEKREQEAEANRLREWHSHKLGIIMERAVDNALDDYGYRVERANIEEAFQKQIITREIPNVWDRAEIDRAISLELAKRGIDLEPRQQQEQPRKRGLRR